MSRCRALVLAASLLSAWTGCCWSNPYSAYNNPCCQQPQCCNYTAGGSYYDGAARNRSTPTVAAETDTGGTSRSARNR